MNKIEKELLECGVPAHLSGFKYLADAVAMVEKDITSLRRITTYIYPTIARENNTTPCGVERAIRHSVETAFDTLDFESIQTIFGNSINPNKGKPTNSQFIASVALRVKGEQNP